MQAVQQCRLPVLHRVHDVPIAGRMGITHTKDHLFQKYYWPRIFTNAVTNYCRSCEACQKSNPKYPIRAKMVSMPLIEQPQTVLLAADLEPMENAD